MFLKQWLLFTYLNPNLIIAVQLWQHRKCLKHHIRPGLPFCPCTELLQNVNVLLSCWLAKRSSQKLLLDVANTFKLLTKLRLFPLKMKLSISCFCFTLWPSVQDSLGNSCPWEVISLVEGHSELPSRKKTLGIHLQAAASGPVASTLPAEGS